MQVLVGGDDGGRHLRPPEQLAVVLRDEICLDLAGNLTGPVGILLGEADPLHRRMARRHLAAEEADTTAADDSETDAFRRAASHLLSRTVPKLGMNGCPRLISIIANEQRPAASFARNYDRACPLSAKLIALWRASAHRNRYSCVGALSCRVGASDPPMQSVGRAVVRPSPSGYRSARPSRWRAALETAFPFVVVGALWEVVARLGIFHPRLFPSLEAVAAAFVRLTASGALPHHAFDTILRLSGRLRPCCGCRCRDRHHHGTVASGGGSGASARQHGRSDPGHRLRAAVPALVRARQSLNRTAGGLRLHLSHHLQHLDRR